MVARVKDFVDMSTRKNLVQTFGKDTMNKSALGRQRTIDILAYLQQPHSSLEVWKYTNMSSLDNTFHKLKRMQRDNLVMRLDSGLYIATGGQVETFNAAQLSEDQLQEKGLEAFKRNLSQQKITKPLTGADIPHDELIAYLNKPRYPREVIAHFGITTSRASLHSRLIRLAKHGELRKLTGKTKYRTRYVAVTDQPETQSTPSVVLMPRVKQLPEQTREENSQVVDKVSIIEAAAKEYVWDYSPESAFDLQKTHEIMRAFLVWIKDKNRQ